MTALTSGRRALFVVLSALVTVGAVACSEPAPSDAQPEVAAPAPAPDPQETKWPALATVIYQGDPTDEALVELWEGGAAAAPGQTLVLESPTTSTLSKWSTALFSFRIDGTALHEPARVEPSWRRRLLREVVRFVDPIPNAHAHGPPFTGEAYYLEFSHAEGEVIRHVFSDAPHYVVEPEQLLEWANVPQPITLSITWGRFDDNELAADGGPFEGGRYEYIVD